MRLVNCLRRMVVVSHLKRVIAHSCVRGCFGSRHKLWSFYMYMYSVVTNIACEYENRAE